MKAWVVCVFFRLISVCNLYCRSKGPGKRHQHRSQEFIASLLSHGSSGYQSEDEWEEEEEEEGVGLDVAESATMLEEEGIVVGEQSRTISKQVWVL